MKTENQILTRLETDIEELNALADGLTNAELRGEVSEEKRLRISVLAGNLFLLAWVLDCEDQLRPALTALKLGAVAEKLQGRVDGP